VTVTIEPGTFEVQEEEIIPEPVNLVLSDIEGASFSRQKILEKKLQVFFAKELLKEITKYYWDAFEALNLIRNDELNSIVCSIDT
jgi:hypothetical protein